MFKTIIIGNITRNAELKTVSVRGENRAVSNFSVAVNEGFGDSKKTTFIRCAIWGKRAEALNQYLTKGTKISVIGSISARAYQTKDNELRAELELTVDGDIELLGGGQRSEGQQAAPDYDAPAPKAKAQPVEVAEDSLPF